MNRLLTKYQQQVTERPLRTFACQSGTMFTIGDLVAQQAIEKKGNDHDAARTIRMGVYGFCIGGPMVGSWFTFLNNAIKIQHRVKGALVRLAIDQTCFTPTLNAVFLTSISLLEGRSFAEIREKFRTSYFTAVCNSYRLWPFVNLFGFLFIHPPYRPLTNSVIAIGWNAYLSYLNQQALKTSADGAPALAASNNTNALSSDTSTTEQTQPQQQAVG
ncbi:hypothetical protein BDB00DRAFT_810881 [Zychaea mexicana]|uniref:uncharacterized protein n=1 Tax=Zychaea mexicana TaxID=64656 RepID=UPI0022FED7F9|nr:uncharacterized protein BDB00DRAFT_810881 [Zychaea mexicana]KAI9495901.1 hypothetical protein BDB00DRAFT_810881 [Zychaea mexicana]